MMTSFMNRKASNSLIFTLHYTFHYIRFSLAVCVYGCVKNDDVIYEPKGVQFVDIYITLHYIIHYITLGPP